MRPTRKSYLLCLPVYLLGLIMSASLYANDANTDVKVANLTVKERLKSMEQINVSAEKPVEVTEPENEQLRRLLEEADALDAEQAAASDS